MNKKSLSDFNPLEDDIIRIGRAAAYDCGTYRSQIRKAIRSNGIAGGYTWKNAN